MLLQTPYRRVCISQHLPVPLPAAQSDVSPNLHGTHRPRTLLADDSRVARTHNPAVEQAGMTRGARGGTTGIALARARASPGPWPRARPSFWPASTAAAAAAAVDAGQKEGRARGQGPGLALARARAIPVVPPRAPLVMPACSTAGLCVRATLESSASSVRGRWVPWRLGETSL